MDEAQLMLRLMAAAQRAVRKIPVRELPGLLDRCRHRMIDVAEIFKQAEPMLMASGMLGPRRFNGPNPQWVPIGRFTQLRNEAIRLTLQAAIASQPQTSR